MDDFIPTSNSTDTSDIPVYDSGIPHQNTPSPDTASERAGKAVFGMSDKIPTDYETFYNTILKGMEPQLRKQLGSQMDEYRAKKRQENITQYANLLKGFGRDLTFDDIDAINKQFDYPSEPSSIIEDHYARRYMSFLNWNNNDPDSDAWTKQAQMIIPKQYTDIQETGIDVIRTREFIGNLLKDNMDTLEDQSTVGAIVDWLKTLVPGYDEYKLYDRNAAGIFLGSNLEESTRADLRLPWEERKTRILGKYNELKKDNPQMASRYLQALLGQSTLEVLGGDVNSAMNAATLAGMGVNTVRFIAAPFTFMSKATSAVDGVVRSVRATERAAETAARAAAGDLEGAAAATIKKDLRVSADPKQRAIDYLVSFFRGRLDAFRENVGTGNMMELVRKIESQWGFEQGEVIRLLTGAQRPSHFPEEVLNAIYSYYKTDTELKFPGMGNQILDFSVPYRGPENAYWYNIHLGTTKGTYFESPEAAHMRAVHMFPGKEKAFEIVPIPENLTTDELANLARTKLHEAEQWELRAGDPRISKSSRGEAARNAKTARKQAEIYNRRIRDFGVEGSGSGYYIKISKPLDLTQDFVRQSLVSTGYPETLTPQSWVSALLGKVRTPDETLSEFQRRNRGIAVHGPHVLMELAHSLGKDLIDFAKGTFPLTSKRQRFRDLEHVMEEAQQIPDPARLAKGDNTPGYTFRNIGELQLHYMRFVGRLPEDDEIKAYFSWSMLNDLDHVLRNASVVRNKAQVGAESHVVFSNNRLGNRTEAPAFDGVNINHVPRGQGNYVEIGEELGKEKGGKAPIKVGNINAGKRKEYDQLLKQGKLKIIRIYDEYANPLSGFGSIGDHSIRYVFVPTKNVRTNPLSWDQLPQRGGGHFIYDSPFFAKQAIMSHEVVKRDDMGRPIQVDHVYKGDKTVAALPLQAMGRDWVNKINTFREMLRRRDFDGARTFLRENPLGEDFKELIQWFGLKEHPASGAVGRGSTRDPRTGRMIADEPRLDINEPISLVDRNQLIGNMSDDLRSRYHNPSNGQRFFNGTRGGSLANQRQVSFTGERDSHSIMHVFDDGQKGNPIYKFRPAELLSPINALNRGLAGITNSFFLDEYRFTAMEHWLQEAKPFLDLEPGELENASYSVFNNPRWLPGADKKRVSELQVAHYQIDQLVGKTASVTDGVLHAMAQSLADTIYTKMGPRFIIDPLWVASRLRDPARSIRAFTFHTQLGFFNFPQYLRQLQTFSTIFGVAGYKNASSGTLAAFLHGWTAFNNTPEFIGGLDKLMSRLYIPGTGRWKIGEYREATELANLSGFFKVAGEYAQLDSQMSEQLVKAPFQKFLDLGTGFFRGGERMVRKGAWYTAYREMRDQFPTGALTDEMKAKILLRARDLNVNMDRAGNSIWQHGLGSIPLQFLTYQARSAELLLGHRLPMKDKLRLLYTNALLYGIGGTAIIGLPFGDWFKKAATEYLGYDVGSNYVSDTVMQGVPAALLAAASGNWYNIGETLGPQGWEPIREMFRGDRPVWNLALGAVGTTLQTAWEQSDGIRKMAMSAYADDDRVFPFVPEDVLDTFNILSSSYHVSQTWMAMNTGRWVSRKGTLLTKDITPLNAIFMYLAGGLSPEQAANVNNLSMAIKDRQEDQKKIEQFFIKEYRRGVDAAQSGAGYNPDQALKYFKRAFTALRIGGYPYENWDKALSLANDGYETLVERMNQEFWTKNVYNQDKEMYNQIYQKQFNRTHP